MSQIREQLLGTMGTILGLAIGLAILAIVAGLSVLAAGTSAGITSAITQINAFLVIVGIGVAVGTVVKVLGSL